MKHKKVTTITIPKTEGEQLIGLATDVFTYIDPDFKDWNLNQMCIATAFHSLHRPKMKLDIYELTEDKTFAQIFTKPDTMVLTQEQIVEFCKNHEDKLSNCCTFFLFKVGEQFFVARVFMSPAGLGVGVSRLPYDDVWRTGRRLRFVIPQLVSSGLKNSPLDTDDSLTLEKRVKSLEEQMESLRQFLVF